MPRKSFLTQYIPRGETFPSMTSPAFCFKDAKEAADNFIEQEADFDDPSSLKWKRDRGLRAKHFAGVDSGFEYASSNRARIEIVCVEKETVKDWEEA